MKWENKGNEEIEEMYSDLKRKDIFIFGAGEIGRGLYISINRLLKCKGFVDNNPQKHNKDFMGTSIYSLERILEKCYEPFFIVAATKRNEDDICEQLRKKGLSYCRAQFFLDRVLPAYIWFKEGKLMMNLAQICLTERCTLRCRDCAHACFAVKRDAEDMDLDEVKTTCDDFFLRIDYIHEFVLIGGEPLLYKDLDSVIAYIGEHYRDKIGIFSITTNGTMIPNEKILHSSALYDVYFRISNYSRAIPRLSRRYKELLNLLNSRKISYYFGKAEEGWVDYGFKTYRDLGDAEHLIRKFDLCATPCREIRNSRLYYCVMARTNVDNLHLDIGEDDYLNLANLPEGDEGKRIILEYNLGYSDKGYLDACAYCRGAESYHFPIEAATQVEG